MSLARDMAVVGQTATAFFEEDEVKNLRSGKVFRAKIQPIADIGLNEALGRDVRESDTFHFLNRAVLLDILQNDKISAIGEKFLVLRRQNNPATLHIEYGCMKLTEKDA